MAKIEDLYQPRIGPEGEIELVPKGNKMDPYAERDNCPKCLCRGKVIKGLFVDRFGPSIKGNVFDSYRCPKCGFSWVWDKRYKHWHKEEIEKYRRELLNGQNL